MPLRGWDGLLVSAFVAGCLVGTGAFFSGAERRVKMDVRSVPRLDIFDKGSRLSVDVFGDDSAMVDVGSVGGFGSSSVGSPTVAVNSSSSVTKVLSMGFEKLKSASVAFLFRHLGMIQVEREIPWILPRISQHYVLPPIFTPYTLCASFDHVWLQFIPPNSLCFHWLLHPCACLLPLQLVHSCFLNYFIAIASATIPSSNRKVAFLKPGSLAFSQRGRLGRAACSL
jgi:hypothetical protein